MPDSAEKFGKAHTDTTAVRGESEYVRLVISDEPRTAEAVSLQPQASSRWSRIWWIKALIWCSSTVVILLVLLKLGVPFLFEKVIIPILQWEATAFGRPALALVLLASLALFPV